jgi:hypothetical protein
MRMAGRPRHIVIVRRGEAEVFRSLQEHFSVGPDPTPVIYDRRVRDRRVIIQDREPERRNGERRAPIDATMWTRRGFVVVRVDRIEVDSASVPGASGNGRGKPARARRPRRKRDVSG